MSETMQHFETGLLQAHLDGELPGAESEQLIVHLANCAECRHELEELDAASRLVAEAITALHRPFAPAPTPFRGGKAAHRSGGGWPALPRAAVLVLGFAAAASAAVPGSPVRGWLESLLGADVPTEGPPPAVVSENARGVPETGVTVAAESGTVRIDIDGAARGVVVTTAIAAGPRAGVFASGAAASARFTTGPGRIVVHGAPAGELRIGIPAAATSASVHVDGRRYVRFEDGMLRFSVPGGTDAGTSVRFRIP
jgi:hypothetical protein